MMQKIHLENLNFMGFKDFAVHNLKMLKHTFLKNISVIKFEFLTPESF